MIKILYEDNDILVCHKPAGIAVQSSSVTSPDMETMLRSQILRSGTFKNKSALLHVIHRLDQPVEGIIVFGRNKKAAASLSAQVQAGGEMNKTYLAVVYGGFSGDEQEGELKDYIYKDAATKSAVVIPKPDKSKGAKESSLSYKVLTSKNIKDISTNNVVDFEAKNETEARNTADTVSLVEVSLKTGRYHQIRAQFSNAGHPLLGDRRYCSPESDEVSARLRVRNVALCACKLSLVHPTTKKEMSFEIQPEGDIFKELD
ncbi:RluA family pseudouridine synthase [Butyrivibrio sp. VCD2006]|uniref:RluA family pseudouridine synthase n=1 Tax=Butyrivibrio sp. VCD2006 TaxID=1280664 RepID=UPI0003F54D95|nr:RluA family pseudouridine synthase [Butyrivibrio sp. VCD2006]